MDLPWLYRGVFEAKRVIPVATATHVIKWIEAENPETKHTLKMQVVWNEEWQKHHQRFHVCLSAADLHRVPQPTEKLTEFLEQVSYVLNGGLIVPDRPHTVSFSGHTVIFDEHYQPPDHPLFLYVIFI